MRILEVCGTPSSEVLDSVSENVSIVCPYLGVTWIALYGQHLTQICLRLLEVLRNCCIRAAINLSHIQTGTERWQVRASSLGLLGSIL